MTPTVSRWYSPRLEQEVTFARWGHFGQPVLLFPTAGGDAEEVARMGLIDALGPLLADGRIKVYSCDSVAGRALASRSGSVEHRCWLLKQSGEYVAHELIPAIRADCQHNGIETLAAGASIGAFNAVSVLCRYPHLFRAAVGMSGTYDLQRLLGFQGNHDYYLSAPHCFLPGLASGEHLSRLQQRHVLLAFGGGRWEDPKDSWHLAELLGAQGVSNRVDAWPAHYDHDWPTWREMLPIYLHELVD